jgi:hypothetical protein
VRRPDGWNLEEAVPLEPASAGAAPSDEVAEDL